ncbi:DUF6252 family protein [Bacteroidota bacterium]
MKKLVTLLLAASVLGFSGCTKFDNAPFRCKINGKPFTASDALLTVTISGNDDNFYIQATTNPASDLIGNDPYGEIKLDIVVKATGTYPLNLQNTWRWSNNGQDTYRASGKDPGKVTITELDYAAKRIKGTFELTAYSDKGETKTITEGFFDSKWN